MYIPCLNGLRALAIFLVLASHSVHTEIPARIQAILSFADLGTIGVRLFFLLSGYLITFILSEELKKNGSISLRKFFMRRLLRIFPCFYVYLLTLFVLTYLNVISVDYSAIFFAMFYVQNLNVFQNTELFASSWLVKHSWSLSVEEQFYLVYPFVFAGLKKLIVGHPVKLAVLASLVCTFFRGLNYSFPEISRMIGGVFFMHADFLLYGGVLCIVLQQYAQPIKTLLFPVRYGLLALAAVVALCSARVEYYSGINILIFGNLILFSNAYILLFFLLYPESVLGKWLETRPIKWIGLLSYSLYVWQQLFMGSKNLWSEYGFLATFPFSLLAVFAASIASYYLVERPFLRMKKLYSAI